MTKKKILLTNYSIAYLTYFITSFTFSGWYFFKPGVENPRLTFIALFFIIGIFLTLKNLYNFIVWMFSD